MTERHDDELSSPATLWAMMDAIVRVSFSGAPLSEVQPSEYLLDSQHQFMTCRAIFRRKLLIPVGINEPASVVPHHSGTYRTHLLGRAMKRHSIDPSIGNLLEVVPVRASHRPL
jgi:hypothetical protein